MSYLKFAFYNVIGAVVWTVLFVGAGFFFGNLPVVQKNFTLVVLGIVAVSVVPVVLEVLAVRREAAARRGGGAGEEPKAA
jgi:membrane-associated protein